MCSRTSAAKNCVNPTPESGIPQRESRVAMTWRLIAPNSASGRLRCTRTPMLTCGDRAQAQPVEGIDQQADLDPVARPERQRRQQFPGSRVLAAQRLQYAAQLRPQRRQQRPGQPARDPPATGSARTAIRIVDTVGLANHQGPSVEAFDQVNPVAGKQRIDQPRHEHRVRVDQVGVDEHHDVAAGRRE